MREIRLKRRPPWIKAAAFAVDEIGTEILRSEAAFAVGQTGAQSAPIVERSEAKPEAVNLAGSRAGDGGLLGELCLPALPCRHGYPLVAHEIAEIEMPPDGNGLTSITAGWLESLMGANFGDDFRWGGRLSISYHRAVTPGMELRCEGVTLGHDTDARGVEKRQCGDVSLGFGRLSRGDCKRIDQVAEPASGLIAAGGIHEANGVSQFSRRTDGAADTGNPMEDYATA